MEQFEIERPDGVRGFITVLEEFKHFYTGETIRVVRCEYTSPEGNVSYVEGPVNLDQADWENVIKLKVNSPVE